MPLGLSARHDGRPDTLMLDPVRSLMAAVVALLLASQPVPAVSAEPASASAPVSDAAVGTPPRGPAAAIEPRWIGVPRIVGRLTAADIGLVVNDDDPYSVAVGAYYAERRGLTPQQVLHVNLPVAPSLEPADFESLRQRIDSHFGDQAQAIAFAWTQPYAVRCHSLTGALALGFDPELCRQTCAPSKASAYFNSPSERPWRDLGLRLSMLIAAPDVEQARRLIDRGVASDGSQGLRGGLPATALYVATRDRQRNVRAALYPPPGPQPRMALDVRVVDGAGMADAQRLILLQTGQARVLRLDTLHWLDGALADHLTSQGGWLDGRGRQTTALDWIASGATASYGTVSEPCNHVQKFPHPQVLLLHYLQGSTAVEAYWRSVAWPQQGVFIGEPLAAPYARR